MIMQKTFNFLLLVMILFVSSVSTAWAECEFVGCTTDRIEQFTKEMYQKAANGDEDGKKFRAIESCPAKVKFFCHNDQIIIDPSGENILGCVLMPDVCPTIEEFKQTMADNCIACNLLTTILATSQKIAQQAFESMDYAFISLLCVAFLIWLAYQTLITIASPETQKISKYLTSLAIQGAKVAIAIAILNSPQFLYQQVLTPILESGVDFGTSLLGSDKATVMELGSNPKYSAKFDNSNHYLSSQILEALVGATANFSNEATEIPALGSSLICYSWVDLGLSRGWIIPRISMLVEGIILLIFGFLIWLAVGFYMLDCGIQLGLVCALMAFFVACWPFKMTSKYTKVGWNMFLNTFFSFIIMSVIILTIKELLSHAATGGLDTETLKQYLHTATVETLDSYMDIFSIGILVLVTACLISLKLVRETGNLANKFAGGVHIGMGAEMGALAVGYAQKTMAASGKTTFKAGKTAVKGIGNYADSIAEHSGAKAAAKSASGAAKRGLKNIGSKAANALGFKTKAPKAPQKASFTPGQNAPNSGDTQ